MPTIKESIKELCFKGFEGFEVWRLLYQPSESERILQIRTNWFKIFYHVLFKKSTIVLEKNGGNILLFMFYSGRKDFDRINENVYSLIKVKDSLLVNKNRYFRQLSFLFITKCIINMFSWWHQLDKTELSYEQKKIAIDYLIMNFKCAFDLQKIHLKHYNLAVIFNDADTIGNYVCQYCKRKGIETASLQHGVILAPHPEIINMDFAGIELNNSISDHFLAWNKFTKLQALKTGKSTDKIEVCGIIRCIDEKPLISESTKNIFGVVLDGRYTAELNPILVKAANELAKAMNMRYFLKYHPSDSIDIYDNLVDKTYYIGAYDKTRTIKQYTTDVDFSLIANSTVYMELVFLKHRCFRLRSKSSKLDKYKEIDIMSFSSVHELISTIKNNIDEMDKLYDMLCSVEDIRLSYKQFFEKYS